ncbi:uncharacterized protein [Lepeophtheirus salmonis]|nr:reticulocyte-binding protein 2 homolog a-like isoform X2 [Lepeophtheirus salmonis]
MKKSKIPVLVKKDSISKKNEKSISRKAESSQKEHSKSNDKSSRFKNSEATENVYTPESTVPTNEHSHENPCLEDNTKEPKYKKNTVSTKKKIKKIRKGSPKKTKDDKEEIVFQRKSSIKTENIPKVLHNDADLNAKISDIYSGKNDVNQVTEIKGEKCESLPIIESNLKTEIYKIKVESQTNQSNLIDSNVLSAKKGNFKTLSEKNGEESSKISVHLPKKIPSRKNSLNTSDFEGHNTLVSIHKNVPEPFSEKSQAIKKICSRKNSFISLNVIENEETPSVKLGEKSDPKTIASNLQSTVNTTHEKTFDSNIIHNRTTNGSNNLKTSIKSTEKSESELLKSNILSSTTSVTPIEMEEKIIRIGLNDRKLSLKSVGTELQEKHVFPNIKSYSRRNSSITCTDDATTMTLVDKEALVNSELLKKDHLTPKKSKSKRNSSIIQLHTKNGTRRGSVDRKSSSKQTKNKDLESVKNNILPYTRPLCEINSSINHINTKPTVGLTNGRTSVNSIYSETSKKDSLSSIKPLSRRNSSIIQIDAEHADRKTSANLIDSESLKGDLLLPLHRRNSLVIEIDAETTSGLVNGKKSSKSVDSKRETLSPKKIHSRRNSSIDEVSKIVVDASVSKIDNILQLSSVSQNKKIPSRRNSTIEIFQKFIGIDSQSKSDRNEYVLTIDDVPRTSIPTEENKPVHLGINLSDTGENQRKSDILDYKFKEPSSSSKDEKDHTNYKEIKKDVIIRSQKSDLETDVLSEVKPISSNNSTITNIINNEPKKVDDEKTSIQMENTNREILSTHSNFSSSQGKLLECEDIPTKICVTCKSSTLSVDNEDSSFNTTKTTENTDSLSRESSMKVSRETSKLMEDNHHNKKLSIARRKSLKIIELSDGKSSSKKRSKSFDSIGSESTAHLSVPPIESLSEVNVLPNERSISLIPVNKEPENNDSIETVRSEVQKMLNQKVSKNDKLDLLQSLLASLANEDDFESSEIPNSDLVQPCRMENVNQRTYPPITEVGEELPNLEQTASEKSDHQIQNESHNADGTGMKSLVVESKSDQEEERIDNLQTQYSIIESSQELTDKTANVKELEVIETDETSIVESIDKIKTSRKESVLSVGQQSFESFSEKKVRDESNVDEDESSGDCDDILDSNETPLVLNLEKMELSPKKYSQYEAGSNSSNSLEGSEIESSEEEEYVSEFGLVTDDDTGSNVEKNVQTDNEVKENVFQDDGSDREESLESEYELESFDSENEREKEEELESEYEIEEEEELECEYVLEEEEDLESEYELEEEEELESEHKSKEEEELKSEHKSKEEEKLESEHYSKEEDELESEHKSMDEEELELENKFEEEEELESEHKFEEEEELESEHKSEEEEELEFNHEPEQVVLDEDNRGDDQADKVSLIIDVKSLTPKEDSISELDESLEHDISSSLEKALESIETLKVLQKRLSIDLESINVKKSLIDAETVKTEILENDGNLINVNYGINVSELEQCSKSSPIVDQGSRAVEGGITQDLVVVDKEVILVKDKELFVEKNSDSLENIMENKGIHLSDSKTFIEEDKHKLEIQLFSNNGNSDKINETTEDLIIHTSAKEDETKKALDKILHLMEKLARRSSLLSEENRRKNVNTPLKEDIQDNRRCSSSMSMHEESQVLQVIKTIDREIHSSSRKQSIISNTSSKSNIIEIIGDVEEVIQEKGEYEERLSLRSSLSPDHQLSDGKNVSPISDTMEIDCQVSKEDAFLNEKEKTSLKASRSSSLEIEDKKIRPECTEDVKKDLNIDPQRDFAKEVEVALENIIEMKSTMTKMMALLEKTSLDQRKPYNDTDSVRSLISQISLYSDMVQDIMPVIQEKDTEDPLCLLDRSSGRRASTISLIEEKSSSTLPSPPSFTAFYDESPNIMEEVNVSSIQVQKHKSYDKLNEKEDTNIKAEVSSKIDEKMKFFDNLSKIPLIRGGDTEKMNNLDSLMVKKSTILEGVSEDSLLPVSKQRQVFEREAMKAMFEEVSIQKQVPGKVGGHKESDISNKESKLYKILFIGSSSAGKTSIIRRYVKHTFTPSYRATIGADFLSKVIHWDEAVTLRLQLWDIAGQDRFSLLSRSFYKDAVGAFIVCDISRPDTLDACIPWKEELDAKVQTSEGGKLPCFLLANKCDLVEDSTAQSKLTSKVCQMHGFHGWMQTSAKEDINITQAIEMLLRQIVKQDIDSTPFATDQESLVLENEGRKKKRSGCLC